MDRCMQVPESTLFSGYLYTGSEEEGKLKLDSRVRVGDYSGVHVENQGSGFGKADEFVLENLSLNPLPANPAGIPRRWSASALAFKDPAV